jgi:hypothetical protein
MDDIPELARDLREQQIGLHAASWVRPQKLEVETDCPRSGFLKAIKKHGIDVPWERLMLEREEGGVVHDDKRDCVVGRAISADVIAEIVEAEIEWLEDSELLKCA